MKVINVLLIGIAMIAVLTFCAKRDAKMNSATREDCVAYWTARTSTWDNPPSLETIETETNFCGNVR